MDMEIENLLFKQVSKPKNHIITKVVNLWKNRYRVNIYIEIIEDTLVKKKIHSSYFCHYSSGELVIIPDPDKKSDDLKKKKSY